MQDMEPVYSGFSSLKFTKFLILTYYTDLETPDITRIE